MARQAPARTAEERRPALEAFHRDLDAVRARLTGAGTLSHDDQRLLGDLRRTVDEYGHGAEKTLIGFRDVLRAFRRVEAVVEAKAKLAEAYAAARAELR